MELLFKFKSGSLSIRKDYDLFRINRALIMQKMPKGTHTLKESTSFGEKKKFAQ